MGKYSEFIAPERRVRPTPKSLVRADGSCEFGNFDKEFEEMDLLALNHPTSAPQFLNKLKLTLWEATEVHLKNGVLLAAVCDMGIFGMTLNIFYDKRDHKVHSWTTNLKSKDTKIAPNLLNGSIAEAHTPVSFVKYVNNFQDGRCDLSGKHEGPCLVTVPREDKEAWKSIKENTTEGTIEYSFSLNRLSDRCVASIPFSATRPRPLYSQKDFFKAEGRLVINGEEMLSDADTVAVVDDHRGYYPRKAHYDWVTTMGRCTIDGEQKLLAFNLTRNQSIDQEKNNENILWLEGKSSILPPVTFSRSIESKDFKNFSEWTIKDEHDMVNLKFKVYGMNPMITHAVVVNIDYYVAFGELEGYLRDEDGSKYVLDGMLGMGEDKTLLL